MPLMKCPHPEPACGRRAWAVSVAANAGCQRLLNDARMGVNDHRGVRDRQSELALELISRGHGLIADDIVEGLQRRRN